MGPTVQSLLLGRRRLTIRLLTLDSGVRTLGMVLGVDTEGHGAPHGGICGMRIIGQRTASRGHGVGEMSRSGR